MDLVEFFFFEDDFCPGGTYSFSEAERKILIDIVEGIVECDIVSLSGSSMYHSKEMDRIINDNKFNILFINVPLTVIEERRDMDPNKATRPIVYPDGINTFKELYQQRRLLYSHYHTSVVIVNEKDTPKIQEVHRVIIHIICEIVEEQLQEN